MSKEIKELMKFMTEDNKDFVLLLVQAIIKAGCTVSIRNCEGYELVRSTDLEAIAKAVGATGEDAIEAYNENIKRMGSFYLLYQDVDGIEVIYDHTANEFCEAIWRELDAEHDRRMAEQDRASDPVDEFGPSCENWGPPHPSEMIRPRSC
jgi:hypothetical protein